MYDVAKAILDDRRRTAHFERAAHKAVRSRQGESRRGHTRRSVAAARHNA